MDDNNLLGIIGFVSFMLIVVALVVTMLGGGGYYNRRGGRYDERSERDLAQIRRLRKLRRRLIDDDLY